MKMNIWKRIRKKWHNDLSFSQAGLEEKTENYIKKQTDELKAAISWNNLEVIRMRDGIIRTTPRRIIKFGFDILEKCNLNCAGCLTYSPLADENAYVMSLESFERDIARIAELFCEQEIEVIRFAGGEPLLHTELPEFPRIVRSYFPKVDVRIVTNGMLLLKQTKAFWDSCRVHNVVLEQTKYPIDLDFKKIAQTAEANGVRHIFMDDTGEHGRIMQVFPVDLGYMSGGYPLTQNERLNFFNCWQANQCIKVREGKIYTCSRIPHINVFNKYFDMNYEVSEDDGIDLFSAGSKEEIYQFLAHAVPFCRYCKVHKISEGHAWKKSELKLEEWAE